MWLPLSLSTSRLSSILQPIHCCLWAVIPAAHDLPRARIILLNPQLPPWPLAEHDRLRTALRINNSASPILRPLSAPHASGQRYSFPFIQDSLLKSILTTRLIYIHILTCLQINIIWPFFKSSICVPQSVADNLIDAQDCFSHYKTKSWAFFPSSYLSLEEEVERNRRGSHFFDTGGVEGDRRKWERERGREREGVL